MASLAESMFAEANRSVSKTAGDPAQLAKSFQAGAQLAQRQQQINANKQKLDQMKKQVKGKGIDNVFKFMATADKFQDKSQGLKMLKAGLGPTIQANGVADIFPPELQEAMTTSDEVRRGMGVLESKVKNGTMTQEEAIAASRDIGKILDLSALAEAEKFHISETGKTERSKIVAEGQTTRQATGIQAKAAAEQKKFDEIGERKVKTLAATDFVNYNTAGKRAELNSNLDSLNAAVKRLGSGEITTGSITTKIPGLSSDAAQSIFNQEMRNVENDARAAIMPLLRATLGAQFTDKEGERIFNTVFDPKAPAKENARRMSKKIRELRSTIKDKEAVFIKQGLLDPAEASFSNGNQPPRKREGDQPNNAAIIDDAKVEALKPAYSKLVAAGQSPEQIFQILKQAPSLAGASDDQLNAILKKIQIEGK